MGITMWAQMKLNPAPPDPTQKMIFDWMPLIFTFMLASFPAGLVIYWAWNNTLSVAQQSLHHEASTAPRSSCGTTSRRCSGRSRELNFYLISSVSGGQHSGQQPEQVGF